jgi:type VI secretion system protein ImpK
MTEDPFAEPGDAEHTIIRPRPGGRGSLPAAARPSPAGPPALPARPDPPPVGRPAMARAPAASTSEPPSPNIPFDTPSGSRLPAFAMPLLQLVARLRNAVQPPDPTHLYERTSRALRGFEQRAIDAGVPAEQIRAAHYALCVSIDETVLNTPWGPSSEWARRPLASAFHRDQSQGGRFFELLARLKQRPASFMPVIEIMYLCLSLGVMGRYRTAAQGAAELQKTRAETCALITGQKQLDPDLSPRWKGISAPYRPTRAGVPVWVVYAAALAVCGGLFGAVSTTLNAASDTLYARMLSAPPASMPVITRAAAVRPPPPPPASPVPTALDRLQANLKPDIEAGTISVGGTATMPIVRVGNLNGFAPGSAVLPHGLAAVLERIGAALNAEPGQVEVTAYTDSQPIRTIRFPSNFALSSARAKVAAGVIARAVGNAARVHFQGRADADPIASNATPEGREQNRRLEISLRPDA